MLVCSFVSLLAGVCSGASVWHFIYCFVLICLITGFGVVSLHLFFFLVCVCCLNREGHLPAVFNPSIVVLNLTRETDGGMSTLKQGFKALPELLAVIVLK